MKIESEHTFKQTLAGGVNLFLGAGFSLLAKDKKERPLPTGPQLRAELTEKFELGIGSSLDLAKISTILEGTKPLEFRQYLKERFTVGEFDKRYCSLHKLKIHNIFTTNVDDLLHKIYATSNRHYLNNLDLYGPQDRSQEAINFVALHGSVLREDKAMTFSTRDLASAFSSDRDRWYALTSRLQAHPTLFWGSSVEDSGTLEALNPDTVKGRKHKDKWIVVRTRAGDDGIIQYFRAMDFQIIEADTEEMLAYLEALEVAPTLAKIEVKKATTRDLFPHEAIPEPGTTPVRPIVEFYKGAPPSWYDIFSGRLHLTKHFRRIVNSINSGKHTIILGLPACGKTTLIMQVATSIDYAGHKLVCESPSEEQAKLIVKKLNNEKALIFVDDFADSVDAFDILSDPPNIRLVGADRAYNFDIVSHRIKFASFEILDVTELDDYDIQKVVSLIPDKVRASTPAELGTAEGIDASLFEIMESHLSIPTLKERYVSVMTQLESQSDQLLDFLLICCYVRACRTPVSMDMLWAYFGEDISHYTDIYNMREQLSSIVADYVGEFDDEQQDYYVPRSVHVSEAVLKQAPSQALNRMVTRFHSEVSRYRIHRFDIFRKRAFDKDMMTRAFQSSDAGKEFYERAYSRDPSPYLLQQGALYLANKNRFDEAFRWIDDAITQSQGKIISIRNSHAIILFQANIQKSPEDPTVRKTLEESMSILSDCHRYDKRKTYHALKFADQALQFQKVYGDAEPSLEYLETAKAWIEEELTKFPWHRNAQRLLKMVSRRLVAAK